MVISTAVGRSLAACAITLPVGLGVGVPAAEAKNGDTHITGQGINQTIDCNESTLLVMGTGNQINALGSCWAVTVQGSSNIVIADKVVDNIIVYGNDQTVFYKTGEPSVWDRGRELGMTNRIDRVPA
jgi:Ca2+-binding RTX toxin-like protein